MYLRSLLSRLLLYVGPRPRSSLAGWQESASRGCCFQSAAVVLAVVAVLAFCWSRWNLSQFNYRFRDVLSNLLLLRSLLVALVILRLPPDHVQNLEPNHIEYSSAPHILPMNEPIPYLWCCAYGCLAGNKVSAGKTRR